MSDVMSELGGKVKFGEAIHIGGEEEFIRIRIRNNGY